MVRRIKKRGTTNYNITCTYIRHYYYIDLLPKMEEESRAQYSAETNVLYFMEKCNNF